MDLRMGWDKLRRLLARANTWTGKQTFTQDTIFPLANDAATPTIAFGDGDSGFYETSDDAINIAISGASYFQFTSGSFHGITTGAGRLVNEVASNLNPTLIPRSDDSDSGVGSAAADQLSLIAGGVEGWRITEASNLISHDMTGKLNTSTTQTLTGAGAVDITSAVTHIVTTGVNALTLANGTDGQHKFIIMKTDGGTGTLTPTNPGNFTTLTFDDAGDSAQLLFTNSKWYFMGGTATLA